MEENNTRIIQFHYELFAHSSHSMDAMAFNIAECNLIRAINYINEFVNGNVKVNIESKKDGSIIDILQVVIANPSFQHVVDILLGAILSSWTRPTISKTEEIKNRVEIAEKIRSGNFSQKEAESLVEGDKQLVKWCSEYYKSIQSTNEVSRISTSIQSGDNIIEIGTINHADFDKKIITTQETSSTQTIEGCSIYIVSPVLVKTEKHTLWEGIYSSRPIEFKVEDNEFLKQVYNHEIKFGNGTYISCNLAITTNTKIKDDGETIIKQTYIVKEVSQWADDTNYQYYTKRYKRKILEGNTRQLSLFEDESIEEPEN